MTYDKNSRQRNIKNGLFTVNIKVLSAEFFGFSNFLSIAAFDFRNMPASKTGECL